MHSQLSKHFESENIVERVAVFWAKWCTCGHAGRIDFHINI